MHEFGELAVASGVQQPQRSVQGLTLSLVYINDFQAAVNCSLSLYTGDPLLYQQVSTGANAAARFQSNIDIESVERTQIR